MTNGKFTQSKSWASVTVPSQWSTKLRAELMHYSYLHEHSTAVVWAGLQEKLEFIAIVTRGFPVIINHQNETLKWFTRKHVYYESECLLRANSCGNCHPESQSWTIRWDWLIRVPYYVRIMWRIMSMTRTRLNETNTVNHFVGLLMCIFFIRSIVLVLMFWRLLFYLLRFPVKEATIKLKSSRITAISSRNSWNTL